MIPEIDVWRSTQLMIRQYGDTAVSEADARATALAERPSNEVVSRQDLDELKRLRRENRRLRQEREILAKAAAWFARETDAMPTGSSRS